MISPNQEKNPTCLLQKVEIIEIHLEHMSLFFSVSKDSLCAVSVFFVNSGSNAET